MFGVFMLVQSVLKVSLVQSYIRMMWLFFLELAKLFLGQSDPKVLLGQRYNRMMWLFLGLSFWSYFWVRVISRYLWCRGITEWCDYSCLSLRSSIQVSVILRYLWCIGITEWCGCSIFVFITLFFGSVWLQGIHGAWVQQDNAFVLPLLR